MKTSKETVNMHDKKPVRGVVRRVGRITVGRTAALAVCLLVVALATACGKKEEAKSADKQAEKATDKPTDNATDNATAEPAKTAAKADPAEKPVAKDTPPDRPAVEEAKTMRKYDSVDWSSETALIAAAKGADGLPPPADVTAAPDDVEKTASGLMSKTLTAGTGTEHPGARDTVKCHYVGWTTDGKNFDASYKHGSSSEFPLNRVIAGWTEGLQLMLAGEKRRFWIPEKLAYGGRPGAPAGMLVFDVTLLSWKSAPEAPKTPDNVKAAPGDAAKENSGLASKILKAGTGTVKPTATSVVEVHYSGWTTDGKMFDSSVERGQPAQFPLNRVIAGWTEGLQLMVEGERRRFWIPEELAYKGRSGAPQGMLVFDVELLKILK